MHDTRYACPRVLGLVVVASGFALGCATEAEPVESGAATRFANSAAHIIEFGWDTPRTAAEAEKVDVSYAPFTGVVLDPKLVLEDASERGLSRSVLIDQPVADNLDRDNRTSGLLNAFSSFPDNLLRVNAASLNVGWGGSWATILDNVDAAGKLVVEYGMQGLMLDTELYGDSAVWDPAKGGTPDQAREQGKAFGARYGAAAPNTTIVFTMAHTYVAGQQGVGSHGYDLLAPFIDGMMEGADASITFVDGYETSYGFRRRNGSWFPDSFANARQNIENARSLSLVPDVYDARMKAGFGIWPDLNSQFDSSNFDANYFTPSEFADSVASASAASDGWVWIYSQVIDWYVKQPFQSAEGQAFAPVPEAYRSALTSIDASSSSSGDPPPGGGAECTDECSSVGQKGQCLDGMNYQECGNFDNDPCLEWGSFSCASFPGTTCEAGWCVGGSGGGTGGGCTEQYSLSTGALSGNGKICCEPGDSLVSVADCGVGQNHHASPDGNCGVAGEGAGNNGTACAEIQCHHDCP